MKISSNLPATAAQKNLAASTAALDKTLAALSSGRRINAAGDDAAGLGVATQLSAQARSYLVAQRNANDGISMLGAADAALSTQADLVQRLRELAVQSGNGALGAPERSAIERERTALTAEVDRIAGSTQFNGTSLLRGGASVTLQVGPNASPDDAVAIQFGDTTARSLGLDALRFDTAAGARGSLAALDGALSSLSSARSDVGAGQARLGAAIQTAQGAFASLTAAEASIMDADVAATAAALVSNRIRAQAGVAVLAQANRLPANAMGLLG
jgi:flagellin